MKNSNTDGVMSSQQIRHYYPPGMFVWDTWYLHCAGSTHLFHLQVKRPDSSRPEEYDRSIGHAISKDLLSWEEMPLALRRGDKGAYDDGTLYTGCAVEHEGIIYLFYCSNHSQDGRRRQAMCLATSTDGITFTKYPNNPIIEPDPRWYYTLSDPPPPFPHHSQPNFDCRDLAVVKDPSGDGWLGYVVMRRKGQSDAFHSASIALCRSKDLVNWEVDQPCCTPNRFNCFEVPDVFQLDGRWYMVALTGDGYGQEKRWSDHGITAATIVFQADRPEGPFQEVKDNLLLASNNQQGFSARTVELDGERLMLYTRSEGGSGRLSWPVKLIPRPGGGLLPICWAGIEKEFRPPQQMPTTLVEAENGGTLQPLDGLPSTDRNYLMDATVQLKDAEAAGVIFGLDQSNGSGALVSLDTGGQVSLMWAPDQSLLQARHWPIHAGGTYRLRLVVVDTMVEVYVDDVLVINSYLPGLTAGHAALSVRDGAARFSKLQYRGGVAT